VARPAAPLTAYLLGVAVGQGRPLAGSAARITELAAQWVAAAGGGTGDHAPGGTGDHAPGGTGDHAPRGTGDHAPGG
jgi:Domain of unknown function (DUF6457)